MKPAPHYDPATPALAASTRAAHQTLQGIRVLAVDDDLDTCEVICRILQEAGAGTVFVGEVTELAASTQSKLVRAIAQGTVRAIGSMRESPVDVRVIAATTCNPLEATAQRRLGHELYDRLRSSLIAVPPLRQRREDIPLLA